METYGADCTNGSQLQAVTQMFNRLLEREMKRGTSLEGSGECMHRRVTVVATPRWVGRYTAVSRLTKERIARGYTLEAPPGPATPPKAEARRSSRPPRSLPASRAP